MKDLISYIARALVDFPEEVEVSEVEGRHTTVLELKVAKKDMGKIIGRQGRTAHLRLSNRSWSFCWHMI